MFFTNPLSARSAVLLADGSSLSQKGIQDLLTDPQGLGGDLQELIRIDEVHALLQGHYLGGYQSQSLIGGRGSGVGELLGLADIDLDVLRLGRLADDHAAVDLCTRSDKENASLLGVV